jgi:ABC-type glycerol-3-phosphate transport system substrate-binding protein
MSKFQLILIGVFGIFILIGVLVFAFYRGGSGVQSQISVWGTMPLDTFTAVFSTLPISKDKTISVFYTYKSEEGFDKDFVEALASGAGPDLIFLSQDSLLTHRNKLYVIPYESYPERTFKDTFIEEGELFLDSSGVLAIPITVDPLMMYWNRDVFSTEGVAQPPRYWDEFFNLSKQFTKKDGALNISRATVPLGEYSNITNAKEILSTLMMQAGTSIVTKDQSGYRTTLNDNPTGSAIMPAISALNFYTDFSNPTKTHYSWNRSLPSSQFMFISGDLAVYFGFASEFSLLKIKNPNLNFDVAEIPQSRNSTKITFGTMQGLAITKASRNPSAAFAVAMGLSTPDAISTFAQYQGLPPVRRELLARGAKNPNQALFYNSALVSRAWYDPNRVATERVFQTMIESVTSGRAQSSDAIQRGEREIYQLLLGN